MRKATRAELRRAARHCKLAAVSPAPMMLDDEDEALERDLDDLLEEVRRQRHQHRQANR